RDHRLRGAAGVTSKPDRLIDLPVHEFVERAAAPAPEPGGGSVAALVGALAAGLAAMVCSLTVDRPKYREVASDLSERWARLGQLRTALTDLIDEDVRAYGRVMDAFQLPKSTEAEKQAREAAVAQGLIGAIEAPLALAETASEVVDHAVVIARTGNRTARDDAVMAALLAETAARGALFNVQTNLRLLRPERTPAAIADRSRRVTARVAALAPAIAGLTRDLVEAT
ncbi:MAG TPA: cyclodeaminase/cyclohydrolase family protein, partial [Dehalococcoidia bacterium]|nr:cyclodeaminase/cyclohydrolase family protein [Dehalococcoidia bacterium]